MYSSKTTVFKIFISESQYLHFEASLWFVRNTEEHVGKKTKKINEGDNNSPWRKNLKQINQKQLTNRIPKTPEMWLDEFSNNYNGFNNKTTKSVYNTTEYHRNLSAVFTNRSIDVFQFRETSLKH